MPAGTSDLVEIDNLAKHFPIRGGIFPRVRGWLRAVDGVTFSIRKGETLGLVGESGCGKTTLGRAILRLLEPTRGSVHFDGLDLAGIQGEARKRLRREMQIIFQDADTALDPRMTIGASVEEGLRIHSIGDADMRREIVIDMLRKVGLDTFHLDRRPHEVSSGQRQRAVIARALALRPKFIVADEPVSALDVSIQSQVLAILEDLQQTYDLTYLFISHDLRVVELICDRVAVMYLGKIVELADRSRLFKHPLHPYTQALLSAVPVPDPRVRRKRVRISGEIPSLIDPPGGCRFHPRCPVSIEHCATADPPLGEVVPGHRVACWLHP